MNHFKLTKISKRSAARLGVLRGSHGTAATPFFMPVATQGAVKHLANDELLQLGAEIILANTYHLMLRPGSARVKKLGGLHKFINWPGLILTDSGGFQIFSLANGKKGGDALVQLTAKGVSFKSYVDGSAHELTPERALKIQAELGVDIAVCLDECVALPAKQEYLAASVLLTEAWAGRTKKYHQQQKGKKPLLFAVIQGGLNKKLRLKSLAGLVKIGFDGYNIGGLSVGETPQEMYRVLDYLVPKMPADRPRYLMGVGYPEQIVEAVRRGVDMFDCVIPTREGRHGRLFLNNNRNFQFSIFNFQLNSKSKTNKTNFYSTINITNAKYSQDKTAINPNSKLPILRQYSRAYLNYLFKIKEPLGARLATLNNLEFYLDLMEKIRQSIANHKL